MNKKLLLLVVTVLGIIGLCTIAPEASADKYYDNRADEWVPEQHCYRQCVSDGDGCYYMDNYPYDC